MRSNSVKLFVAGLAVLATSIAFGQVLQRPKVQGIPKVLTKGAGLSTGPTAVAGQAPIIDLALPDGASEARDINDAGMVLVNNTERKTCFLWTAAEGFRPVLADGANFTLEGDATVAGVIGRGLNIKGQIAGYVMLSDQRKLAFLWDPESGMRLLGTLGGKQSVAIDVSDTGVVGGQSLTPDSKSTGVATDSELLYFKDGAAFAWAEDIGLVPIGRFGTKMSYVTSVSPKGTIAGSFGTFVSGVETSQGFTWSREEGVDVVHWRFLFSDDEKLTAGVAVPTDIRDDGVMSLLYYDYPSVDPRRDGRESIGVVVKKSRALYNFKYPGATLPYTIATLGINGADICVGYQRSRGSSVRSNECAFAWRPGAQVTDLENFASGWTLFKAYRINSQNQIVGYGSKDGKVRGFVMTISPTLLPTATSKALTKVNEGVKLGRPTITKPPK